jgi:hypothetical protein
VKASEKVEGGVVNAAFNLLGSSIAAAVRIAMRFRFTLYALR